MMKNWKKIAILLVVLVVFVAAFIFLTLYKEPGSAGNTATPTTSASADSFKPLDIARDQIAKIVLKREGGDIVLDKVEKEIEKVIQKEDGTSETVKEKAKVWVTSGFEVESSKVDDIAVAAETLSTERLIDENPKDITIYGLDKALVTVLKSADGKEYSLEIGDKTPTNDGYYFRKGGTSAVYTIETYKGDTLRYGKFDILSKTFYGGKEPTSEDITTLTFTRDGKEVLTASLKNKDWFITSPLQHKADINDFSKFLNWLATLKVTNYVAENPADLKTYGLDNPKYAFNYIFNGKNYNLKLGSLKDDLYYAQMEGYPYVFTLSSSDLKFVDYSLLDLTESFIYIPNISDVEKLVVEMDGRMDEALIKYETDASVPEEYTFNGKKIDEEDIPAFKQYYQGAIGLMATKVDLEAKPEGKAEIRLTYTMEKEMYDGKVVVIELIPTPDGYGYYLMKNGKYSGLVMSGRNLDKEDAIRAAYKKLTEAMSKTN